MNKVFFSALFVAILIGVFLEVQFSKSEPKDSIVNEHNSSDTENTAREIASKVIEQTGNSIKETLNPFKSKKTVSDSSPSKTKIVDKSMSFSKRPTEGIPLESKEFRLKGQSVFIAPSASAIPKSQYNSSMGRRIASIGNHIIFSGKDGLPVTVDPSNKRKGFATGEIIVKAKPDADLREITKRLDLKVQAVFPHLGLISFVPNNLNNLLPISVELSESSLTEEVKLDISYGGPRAK